jgi:hypothetical protein
VSELRRIYPYGSVCSSYALLDEFIRNGGHITPVLYSEYPLLVARYGAAMAAKHIRFRLAHRHALGLVALEEAEAEAEAVGGPDNKEELDLCQYRETEALDVYYTPEAWIDAKALLQVFKAGLPKEASAYKVYEKREALEVCHHPPLLLHSPLLFLRLEIENLTICAIFAGL